MKSWKIHFFIKIPLTPAELCDIACPPTLDTDLVRASGKRVSVDEAHARPHHGVESGAATVWR